MIFALFVGFIVLLSFYNFYWKRRNLPPGPTPWPIVGNILELKRAERWEDKFQEWKEKYGPVYTYWLGEIPFVSFNSYEKVHEYFIKRGEDFADRPQVPKFDMLLRGGQFGVAFTSGALWKDQRKFAMKILNSFGVGKNEMENNVLNEVQYMFDRIDEGIKKGAKEQDLIRLTNMAVGSITNMIVCGYSFTQSKKEEEFYYMRDLTTEAVEVATSALSNLGLNNPWILRLPYIGDNGNKTLKLFKEIFAFVDSKVQQHLRENDYSQIAEPKDYIDAFLIEKMRLEEQGVTDHFYTVQQLRNACFDLWVAGQESTSATIPWLFAYLIMNPDVQTKMQEELDKVIASDRMITTADRPSLPYTNAVIMEAQRCGNVIAQNILHATGKEVEVEGYVLPKQTTVVPQVSVIMQDPVAFPEPKKFNPDRFIDESGHIRSIKEFLPFSIGRRVCYGEGMAMMEIFDFTANLFNRYKVSVGEKLPSMKKLAGNATEIHPYTVKVERRVPSYA
ncbi:unnamed protein product [Bursaphelenchus xylophilus]|uniref:(pine wood nematode) hypothetical protein n=1 Tax=Bursaphelenchus xylophilus TaxID=6326 RepID=A0A1I7S0J1_BURXY|nr:unnamed protein product [Bursaphelenchus xylophilus]CAG9132280.1 unnamed protein product [Bursaphelenchus xylophilus]